MKDIRIFKLGRKHVLVRRHQHRLKMMPIKLKKKKKNHVPPPKKKFHCSQ